MTMSELNEIDVFISPNGTIRVEVRGAKGKKCLSFTKEIEQLLGGNVTDRTLTDEYYQDEQEISQSNWLNQQH
jgi:hypothetical protein